MAAACAGVSCPAGETCAAGTCHPKACGSPCAADEVCIAGACTVARCVGLTCGSLEFCVNGGCLGNRCNGTCSGLQVCDLGVCTERACVGVICPAGRACTGAGSCGPCLSGYREVNGSCLKKLAKGTPCTVLEECITAFCTDGVCCTSACGGACNGCNNVGSRGDCSLKVIGTPGEPSCAPYACTGTSPLCVSSCSIDRHCLDTHYCDAGSCVVRDGG
jgi:hypothetical protein